MSTLWKVDYSNRFILSSLQEDYVVFSPLAGMTCQINDFLSSLLHVYYSFNDGDLVSTLDVTKKFCHINQIESTKFVEKQINDGFLYLGSSGLIERVYGEDC